MAPEINAERPRTSDGADDRAHRPATELVELTRADCLELLASHRFGRVAVVLGDSIPVIRPVNYAFDPAALAIVFYTARGSKFHALAHATTAAFEIDALDVATRTGWSVIAGGLTEEVTRPYELTRIARLGLEPWAPGAKPHCIRIRATRISGRRIIRRPGERLPTGEGLANGSAA